MAYRDLQVKSIRNSLLERFLEMPGTIAITTTAITTTGVGEDQWFAASTVVFPTMNKPPLPDGIDGNGILLLPRMTHTACICIRKQGTLIIYEAKA